MNTLLNTEINVGVDTGKKQLDIYIRPLAIFSGLRTIRKELKKP